MPLGTGGEFVGGGSSTASGLIVPKNLVEGGPTTSGVTALIIPGISGNPDILPASPSTFSDEFDEDAAGTPTGWTTFNAPDIINTNDALSHLHMQKAASASNNMSGILKAPPAAPFTMIVKIVDMYLGVNTNRAGLVLSSTLTPTTSTGTLIDFGISQASGTPVYFSNKTTGFNGVGSGTGSLPIDTTVNPEAAPPMYLKVVVASATSWIASWSKNGFLWNNGTALNPGFLPLGIGVHVNPVANTGRGEAFFDYVRFS